MKTSTQAKRTFRARVLLLVAAVLLLAAFEFCMVALVPWQVARFPQPEVSPAPESAVFFAVK